MRWNKETCKEEALKYKSKRDFRSNSMGAYLYAHRNGIINDVCHHMEKLGSKFKRCIYCYTFSDRSIYVGLTSDLNKRDKEHRSGLKYSSVFNYIKKTGIIPELSLLSDYVDVDLAIKLEGDFIAKFRSEGYKILNISKSGALGGNTLIWTKEKCLLLAKKCKTTKEFKSNFPNAYEASYKNAWLREICNHMKICKPNNYWTKEICQEIALEYKSIKEFRNGNGLVYRVSCLNGWINDISKHMTRLVSIKGFWTKEKCFEESKKYKNRTEFSRKSGPAYDISSKNGWLSEFFPKL